MQAKVKVGDRVKALFIENPHVMDVIELCYDEPGNKKTFNGNVICRVWVENRRWAELSFNQDSIRIAYS